MVIIYFENLIQSRKSELLSYVIKKSWQLCISSTHYLIITNNRI